MSGFSFRPAVRENVPLLVGIAGGTGSGKTWSAMALATGMSGGKRFAVIDTESRRALAYADRFSFDHGELKAPFTPNAYLESIKAADAAGYPVIVVDSMSHEHAGSGGLLEMHEQELERFSKGDEGKREKNNMRAWIFPKMEHKAFVQHLLQMRAHLILCFRAEPKVEMKKNSKTGFMEIRPIESLVGADGWMPVSEKSLPYELTVSMLMKSDAPGVPIPIKLQDQHRPFVDLKSPITERTGELLAAWASGGEQKKEQAMSLAHILTAIKVAEKIEHIQALTPHVKKLTEEEQTKAREAATKKMAEIKAR
jgi:hypothetical protein